MAIHLCSTFLFLCLLGPYAHAARHMHSGVVGDGHSMLVRYCEIQRDTAISHVAYMVLHAPRY